MREFACAVLTFARVVPLHLAHARAALTRWSQTAFAGIRAKATVMAAGAVVAALGAESGQPAVLAVGLLGIAGFGAKFAIAILERPVGLLLLSRRDFPLAGITPARETLRLLGLDAQTVARIGLELDAGREVRLASFDQENRLLSGVGPIPYFANELITREQFIPRLRHRLDLVAAFGVVAIRKAYQGRISLENEALALAALAGLEGVPRIVSLEWRTRVMYQSFLPGENLGSLMAAKGATVSIQHQVATGRPPAGTWTEESAGSEERRTALRVLGEVAARRSVDALGRMLVEVHEAGVILGDVKYGNVLMQDGRPVLCDFDWSRVVARRGLSGLDRRDAERDIFNYSFGGSLPTVAGVRRELSAISAARPEIGEAKMDFGGGFRAGRRWTSNAGSGLWRAVRSQLPPLSGRHVVDFGSPDAIVLMELLRAGAARVTTYQPDRLLARLARACHGLVELVDNRRYAFDVIEAPPPEELSLGETYDLATAFGVPHDGAAGRPVTAELLRRLGFPEPRVLRAACVNRTMLVATRRP